jgi:hypothetical protein
MRHAEYVAGDDGMRVVRCAWDDERWPCKGEQLRRATLDMAAAARESDR